jgi:hypothetical protein
VKPTLKQMEGQLRAWSVEIDRLMALTQMSGVRAGFDSLIHVDELKALHAIARAKLDEFVAAGTGDRARLEDELERAWSELAAAFKKPMP